MTNKSEMEKLVNIHPGEVLNLEFLEPPGITAYRLSKDLNIPQTRVSEIIKGNRRITADTALRLSKYFENSAKFWLGLQDDYDIEEGTEKKKTSSTILKNWRIKRLLDQFCLRYINLLIKNANLHFHASRN